MDVVFVEKQPYFSHTYLQGEKEKSEDEFWQNSTPFPSVFLDIDINTSSLKSQEIDTLHSKNNGNTSLPIQGMSDSQTGGEILSDIPSSELCVYTKSKYHHNNRDHSSNQEQGQSSPPQVGHSNNPSTFSFPIPSIDKPTDFDIPIALRK